MTSDAQATFAATLVDEWARAGVAHAVVAPGSRSTPLVLALAADLRIRVHVHIDERSAGFMALGIGMGTGMPAVVVTTSGTAAAELHPSVVECDHGQVPLIVCTADRPPELHGVGAPQAIDQVALFGVSPRWAVDVGVAHSLPVASWRSLAARAVAEALGGGRGPGPVHLNLRFADPLVAEAGELPPARPGGRPWHARVGAVATLLESRDVDAVRALANRRRGVIVAGARCGDPEAVFDLAERLDWPVLADARSGCRGGRASVAAFDSILRSDAFASRHAPEVVIRLGAAPASRVLAMWLAACGAEQIVVDTHGAWVDPDRTASLVVTADPGAFCYAAAEELAAPVQSWDGEWDEAEETAQEAIDAVLANHVEPTEPGVARSLTAVLPDGAPLFLSSSMPIRDVEWFGHPESRARVLSNRGANGIDGVVSSAIGAGTGLDEPVVALLGDLAFLHDSNGMLGCDDRTATVVLVVVDNDGGGIFSFLPQAVEMPHARFERFFATPHGLDVGAIAAAYGAACTPVKAIADLTGAVQRAASSGGVQVVHVRTDRAENVAVHDELHDAVRAALDERF